MTFSSQPHPVRCWLFDGHERCAVKAAADHAENRAVWLRGNIDNPTEEAVAVALQQLGGFLPAAPTSRPRPGRKSLTAEQIQEVRDLYGINGGISGLVTMRQLADLFKTSYTTIFNILHSEAHAETEAA